MVRCYCISTGVALQIGISLLERNIAMWAVHHKIYTSFDSVIPQLCILFRKTVEKMFALIPPLKCLPREENTGDN